MAATRRALALGTAVGIGAGGRMTFPEGCVIGMEAVALTRLASGSAGFDSVGLDSEYLGSKALGSACFGSSASSGRGRGMGLAAISVDGNAIAWPNIGAGCGPRCRNSAFVMMATVAAK